MKSSMKIMMKRMKTMFKYLAAVLALWTTPVLSMEASEVMIDNLGRSFIVLHGDMFDGDAERVREVLEDTGVRRVGIVSDGGLTSAGFDLSEVLSDFRVTAVVPRGYACISACAIAFLGAAEYEIKGVLAFHAAWSDQFTDTDMAASQGQMVGVYSAYHMVANGFSFALPSKITQETDRDTYLTFKSLEELMQFYVRTDEVTGGDVADYLNALPLIDGWDEQALMTSYEIFAYIILQRPTQ
jgi:hypothetical protein